MDFQPDYLNDNITGGGYQEYAPPIDTNSFHGLRRRLFSPTMIKRFALSTCALLGANVAASVLFEFIPPAAFLTSAWGLLLVAGVVAGLVWVSLAGDDDRSILAAWFQVEGQFHLGAALVGILLAIF